ncbi:MFS transporter [Pendulispora brunnea]|uniref:MFS transporter n=1 Tax=Pendulispora brunnea TaxID=2905690 RepID=A0ABZ2KA66_9BACT
MRIHERTGSSFLSALTFALGLLPHALAGALSSRCHLPARRTLIGCELLAGGLIAGMAVPDLPVAMLLAATFLAGTFGSLFAVTRAASLPELVPAGLYPLAHSVLRMSSNSAQIASYAFGGLLLTKWSSGTILLIDAATFLISAIILYRGLPISEMPAGAARRPAASPAIHRDSWVALRKPELRALVLLGWLLPVVCVVPEALAVPYARGMNGTGWDVGVLLAALSAGSVVGEFWAGRTLGERARVTAIVPLGLMQLIPLLVYGMTPIVPIAAVALFVSGLGAGHRLGLDQRVLELTDPQTRGPVLAIATAGLMIAQGAAFAAAGALGDTFAPHWVVAGSAIAGIPCALLLMMASRSSRSS